MICLDSTFIIDFLNGRNEAVSLLAKQEDKLVTTEINVFEVFFGIYIKKNVSEGEEKKARDFFNSIDIIPMKKGCGKLAAKIIADLSKKGIKIERADSLISSIILENGWNRIITKNKKHFSRVEGLEVINY